MTSSQAQKYAQTLGLKYLAEKAQTRSMDARIDARTLSYRLHEDWEMGDTVVIRSTKWGFEAATRVRSFEWSLDRSGEAFSVTIGNPMATLSSKLHSSSVVY